MKPDAFNKIYETLLELSNERVVWPDPREALVQSTKLLYIQELADVAARVTKTQYPVVSVVPDPLTMEWHDNMVLKRNFSDTGEHVFHRYTKDRDTHIKAQVEATKMCYKDLKIRGNTIFPTWFTVPHIPQLLELGEIRVFFVRGEISYMVFTRPSKIDPPRLEIHPAISVTPLESIS